MPESARPAAARGVPWRSVALPVEHGGWSFLFEPVVLGLVLSPSLSGALLGLAALAGFLVRHPLRLVALDRRKGASYPRTALALRFVAAYAGLAAAFAGLALARSGPHFLSAVVLASPLALFALAFDLTGRGREATAEVAGAIALGASSTAILLAGGAGVRVAWMAWALQALRALTAILYVRARLRHEREGDVAPGPVMATHAGVFALVAILAALGLAPSLAAAAFGVLLARAAWFLLRPALHVRAQRVGVQEVLFGLVTVALFAIGLARG